MFTPEDREHLRRTLIDTARADERITGGALFGSASLDAEDRWSDIDLTFGLAEGTDPLTVLAEWTTPMYAEHGAVAHLDITRGAAVYRVFLLGNTLQVDLAFAPAAEFGAVRPSFRLLFGTAAELPPAAEPDPRELVDYGWLYALHVRSALARGRVWQAEYMLTHLREQVLTLACLRHELPTHDARGTDRLPAAVTGPVAAALVGSLEPAELSRAFTAAAEALLTEAGQLDPALAERLAGPLRAMTGGGPAQV